MPTFQPGAGAVVAADSQSAVAAADEALLSGLRFSASFIETIQKSDLPVAHSQKVLNSLTASLKAFVDGRADIVSAIRQLNYIKSHSNLKELDFGCPVWEHVFEGASLETRSEPVRETQE